MEENIGYNGDADSNIRQKAKRYALIDGLNIALSRNDKTARLLDLLLVESKLKEQFDAVEIIIDASARYVIDDRTNFDTLVEKSRIIMGPAGIDCDDLIWARAKSLVAKGHKVTIVSNDMFPVRRSKTGKVKISNLVVSIFPDGEIYTIKRNSKYLLKNENSGIEMFELNIVKAL